MKEQAAYSLLYLSGKTPTQADVEAFMNKCGITVDKDALKAFFAAVSNTSVTDAVNAGEKKCVTMPTGGGARPAGAAAAAEEAPKEDAKKEEEEDLPMGNLFGDDDDDY